MSQDYVVKRAHGTYYYRRRVPSYATEEMGKKMVFTSLKTNDLVTAQRKAANLSVQLEALWNDLAQNGKDDAELKYNRVVKMAKLYGFNYLTTPQLEAAGAEEIIKRTQALASSEGKITKLRVQSLLGGVEQPQIMLSQCFKKYEHARRHELITKNPKQVKRWRTARLGSYEAFLASLKKDKPLIELTRDDIMHFREVLMEKHIEGKIVAHTFNKNLFRVKIILSTVAEAMGISLDIDMLFHKTKIKEKASVRQAYDTEFVKEVLLNRALFEGINDEAYFIIPVMANTGMRPSEVCGLEPEDIKLDAPIPHVILREKEDTHLKTETSARVIPLLGCSLWAFQQIPGGFKHYFRNADAITTLINKAMRVRKLQPSDSHSLYSLRHTFQDMLRKVGADERIQCELMGHAYKRQKYGSPSLEEKKAVIERFAFQMHS